MVQGSDGKLVTFNQETHKNIPGANGEVAFASSQKKKYINGVLHENQ